MHRNTTSPRYSSHGFRCLQAMPLLGPILAVLALPLPATAGPAEDYLDAQLRVVTALDSRVDAMADAADQAAAGLVAGGNVYLAGERGIVSELAGRAGGLCGAKAIPADKPLPKLQPSDVVFFSDYGLPTKPGAGGWGWKELAGSGALVLAFASAENPILREPLPKNVRPFPLAIPCDSRMVTTAAGERTVPTASPAVALAQWAVTAELIGACRRQNRQLAVYLSMFLDEGHRRLKRTRGLLFEPDLRPSPVARGQYAREYLAKARGSLTAIRGDQIEAIRKAGQWFRETSGEPSAVSKRQIVGNLMGHLPPVELGAPEDKSCFTQQVRGMGEPAAKWIRENLHEGDLYFFLGYQQNEDVMAAAAKSVGARTVFITSRAPDAEAASWPRHLYINPHWAITDGCVELEGYDVKACPLSGVIGMTCYWAIRAESLQAGR